jgi:subtilisin-like proprotein convertase family protein
MSRRFHTSRRGVFLTVAAALWVLSPDVRGSLVAPDALLENQWHLKDRATEVGGANVRAAWPSSTGAGVVIGIVDDGLQYAHPDLAPNYLASASWDFNFNDADPQPYSTSGHGTAIAGVAAARGDNTIGVSGVAPLASLAGLRLTASAATDTQEANAFGFQPDVIDILNNSWNPTDNGTTLKAPGPLAASARQSAALTGRNGKGRIFVWSSGNGRLAGDDCNYDGYANSRFAIAVGASTDAANQVTTSEGCSALMVLAPAGGGSRALTTTDLIGTPGYDGGDYASAFGTSTTGGMNAAAPTVSGTVALMLARNPNLTWRDVKHILRRTAIRIIPTDPGWTTLQFPHNERLGFGLLDAEAAVDMAGTWTNVPAEEVLSPATKTVNQAIPDINSNGINSTITISSTESNFVIEHVEVDFNATHTWRGDLQVKLTAPSGVVSSLAPIRPSDGGDNFTNWKFGSVRHFGQTAAGVWTLNVADKRYQDTGTWQNWTLRIYGYRTAGSAPGDFQKATPSNGATGQSTAPTLDWGNSNGATEYEYCYDATNDGACANWVSTGTNTSAVISGLVAGATYYWQVRALNATGLTYAQGSSSASWAFTTVAPPAAFVHTSPSNNATGQSLTPTLTWSASSGATGYEYCYDTSNNGTCNATWISNGASTSVALSGLAANTAYSWHVRSVNASGAYTYADGAATTFWNFTTLTAPGAFSHTSPADGATGQSMSPTLSWGVSSGATGYQYCIDTTNDGACSAWTSTGANTSVALSGLSANTAYFWHVRATNAGGTTYADGAATAFSSFTTMGAPGAFSHIAPSNGATGQSLTATLDWSDSSGASTYEYCYDTSNNGACNATWISTGASTSASLGGLTAGTQYFWHVRATNGGGTTYAGASASAFWSFTTVALPGAFTHVSPSNGATGQSLTPTLDWSNSSGATSYEYCFDTTNDNACANWTSAGANTNVNLSGLNPGTQYFWQVRAANAGGTTYADGGAAAYWSFTTVAVPGAFSHSSPVNGGSNVGLSPTLSWSASTGATSYEYCIDTTNDGACNGWTSTGSNTSVALSNLAVSTIYYWQVRAMNAGGTTYADGSASNFWSFTSLTAPSPYNRTSPSNGASGLLLNPTLSWQASAGAASYEYCFDTTNDGACANWIAAGANTSVGLSNLTAGTPYFWQVRATNVAGTTYASGGATSFWSFTTMPAPVAFNMSSPANSATGQSINPTLSWSPSPNATSFEYCIDTTNDNACSGWTSTGLSTSVALNGLPNGTAHYWHVRAVNAVATVYAGGSATGFRNFTTQVAVPAAFSHASPANGATALANNPTLSWTASAGATSYEYCIDTTNDNACSGWTPAGTNTSVALSNLAYGTPHYWQVRAINAGGTTYAEGSASAYWNFTTQVAVPAAFNRTSPSNGASSLLLNPTLSWQSSTGATSYEYCLDTTNDGACANWISTGANTSVNLSNLTAGTPYFWQVRANNVAGTTYSSGGASSFWSFTTMPAPVAFNMSSPANGATGLSSNPTLTWSPSPNAASFEYCIDTTDDDSCANWISTGTSTSVALSGLAAGTAHFWHVRAVNGVATVYAGGSAAAFWSFTTQANAPGAFTLASPANGATAQSSSPTLSWAASAGATGYQYCIDTTNDNACSAWTSTGTNTSVALSNLAAGTTHYWHVRASNAGGTTNAGGSPTAFWSFTTQVNAPGAFTLSSPANGATAQSSSPTLSWAASAGAMGYQYCIDTTNDNACSTWTSTGTNTSVALSNLAAGTTHYWHVRASNAGGTTNAGGSSTAFWSFTTQIAAPGAFSHTSPANGATGQPKNSTSLTWGSSTGATSYQYCYDTTNDNACSNWISNGTNTTAALSGLTAGTTYYWHARASNAGGTTYAGGSASTFWSFTIQPVPGAFNKANPGNGATGVATNLTMTWAAASGAASYEICYDTTNDNACTAGWTNVGANTNANINGLSAGTTYYWHVRALNSGGMTYAESNPVMYWTLTTQVAAPGAFTHTSPANGAVKQSVNPTLDWSTSAGAASYEYCIDAVNNGACDGTWISTGSNSTAALSGLLGGTQYFWQVRAINPGGTTYAEGSASAYWSFTTKTLRKTLVDLNGDGRGDVFTYNEQSGAWARQVSQANGGFSTTDGSWSPGWKVTPVHFNTDALTDFFLFNPESGQWFKMLNTGSGFTSQAMGSWWQGWERYVMDLDGDGVSDMFLYDPQTGTWFKAFSTADGFSYTQGGWNPAWEIYPMTLNDDDIGDMFLINRTTGRWFWVLGAAGGNFSYPVTETWFPGWNFHPGDFNGDGLTDVLLHDPPTGTFFVATANAAGFTYQQGGWSTGWVPTVADFDADGSDDLFLHDPSTGVWFEMVSDGNGNFINGGGQTWSLGWKIHPTDTNGDGRTDILLYHPGTGAWYEARNTALGSFSYNSGAWESGLTIVVRPPIR